MRSDTKVRVSIVICLCLSIAFGIVSSVLMYQAGCAQNGAGQTHESIDISFFSVQAMLISYGLLFPVFMIWPNVRPAIGVLRALGFFLVWIPVTLIIETSIESYASEVCAPKRWRQMSEDRTDRFNDGDPTRAQLPNPSLTRHASQGSNAGRAPMPTASAFLCSTTALRSYQPNSSLDSDTQQRARRFAAHAGCWSVRR